MAATPASTSQTVPQRFLETVAEHGSVTALAGPKATWTYEGFAAQIAMAACGLKALGVGAGDRVAMMMRNRVEFHVADAAAQFLGATPFSLYVSASPEEVGYAVAKASASAIVVGDHRFLDRFRGPKDSRSHMLPRVVVDEAPVGTVSWGELMSYGTADLEALGAATRPETPATIIFTSGTTGPAKAAIITQGNVCAVASALVARTGLTEFAGLSLISYLPMAHIAERLVSLYLPMLYGLSVHPLDDLTKFVDLAQEVEPGLVFGVPRVWEKMQQGVLAAVAADPAQAAALDDGIAAARDFVVAARSSSLTDEQRETWDFLDAVAFSTLRKRTGLANVKLAVTSAAPISPDLLDWFQAARVPLSECYGMTETTGVVTWSPNHPIPGTVGQALDTAEVRIAEDGEVLVRGPMVFAGYLDEPDKTAEALEDVWLHTGDIGTIDEHGYLRIVDRKKELIITAGGENISPANLEAALKTVPLIANACVVGDRQKFPAAIITLDPEQMRPWAAANGLSVKELKDFAEDPAVRAAIQEGVDQVNERFTRAYQIKKFIIVPDEWLPDSDLMTPTFKLKRRGITARYAEEIAGLYAD
jgi:long-chain acyl-CoA synthetase